MSQISIKGKHYLSDKDTKALLGSEVILCEKLDGANIGLVRHKDHFRLQKRGSLVDLGEHAQFNYFKAWSQINYDKIMKIPDQTILYCELMYAKHTVFYNKLPDYVMAFAWYNKKLDFYYHRDELVGLCENIGIPYVPEITRGYFSRDELFNFIPQVSNFGDEPAEGIIVWNHKRDLRGKVVREEFQKHMDQSGHWMHKEFTENLLRKE